MCGVVSSSDGDSAIQMPSSENRAWSSHLTNGLVDCIQIMKMDDTLRICVVTRRVLGINRVVWL